MASSSKENQLLRLLFENSPLKHWHFEELVKLSRMTRAAVNKWLKRYLKEGLVARVKEKGKFPYFTCGSNNPEYISRKREYSLTAIHESGLFRHLLSLKGAKTVVIFGSMARGDWYKDSDIDIFIYGNPENIKKHNYEIKLGRDIELHIFESKEEIHKVKTGLIKNIIDGYVIKGSIRDFAEVSC